MKVKRAPANQFKKMVGSKTGESYGESCLLRDSEDFRVHLDIIPPHHSGSAFHFHLHSDESIFILEGTLFACEEDEILQVRQGDFITFEKGDKKHRIENRSDSPAKILVITTANSKATF